MPDADHARPIVMAWSGGKDCAMALDALLADHRWRPIALLTTVTREQDRISMHGVRRALLEQQAAALDLPLFIAWLEPGSSNEAYTAAWGSALHAIQAAHGPVSHLAYGDLFLDDVRAFRDAQCAALGWTPHYPLWGRDTAALARTFIDRGYEAVLTCVDTTQLEAHFAGHAFDDALLAALPTSVDPCGERGEFHTFVWRAPMFRLPLPVRVGARVRRDGRFEYADLLPASSPLS